MDPIALGILDLSAENESMIQQLQLTHHYSDSSLEIYPNPSSDEITIKVSLNMPQHSKAFIYNSLGYLIQTIPLLGITTAVDTKNLPAGSYICKIESSNEVLSKQFVLIK